MFRRLEVAGVLQSALVRDAVPFGFHARSCERAAPGGKWQPTLVNQCVRLSRYRAPSAGFAPHFDAPFTERAASQSATSIVLYLSDSHAGGHTVFYQPPDTSSMSSSSATVSAMQASVPPGGLTVDEEIALAGGLDAYRTTSVVPRVGHAVLFLHDVLHAGAAVSVGTKHILRADLVYRYAGGRESDAKRDGGSGGGADAAAEHECREAFAEAQRRLVLGQDIECSKWFQRANSLRRVAGCNMRAQKTTAIASTSFVSHVRRRVPVLADVLDVGLPRSIVLAFGDLGDQWAVRCTSRLCRDSEAAYQRQKWLRRDTGKTSASPRLSLTEHFTPSIRAQSGSTTTLEFRDARFVALHLDACLRVLAMLACFTFGATPDSDAFVAEYDPQRRMVKRGSLACLLVAAFFQLPCRGVFVHLDATVDTNKNAKDELEKEREDEAVGKTEEEEREEKRVVHVEGGEGDAETRLKWTKQVRGTETHVASRLVGRAEEEAFLKSIDQECARQDLGIQECGAHIVPESVTGKPDKRSFGHQYDECWADSENVDLPPDGFSKRRKTREPTSSGGSRGRLPGYTLAHSAKVTYPCADPRCPGDGGCGHRNWPTETLLVRSRLNNIIIDLSKHCVSILKMPFPDDCGCAHAKTRCAPHHWFVDLSFTGIPGFNHAGTYCEGGDPAIVQERHVGRRRELHHAHIRQLGATRFQIDHAATFGL